MKYRPDIDGLRALAVVPVILFHLGFGRVSGGYLGVDVFFVISGFLITSIILNDLRAGTFSFRGFWARRVRRILPVLIAATATCLLTGFFFMFRGDQGHLGRQAVAALLSLANLFYWEHAGDYWGQAAEESVFLHTWSLSVEEQFYLLYPLALWGLWRWRPGWISGEFPGGLAGVLAAGVVLSLGLFLWGVEARPASAFYLLPSRAWELGVGGFLAAINGSRPADPTPRGRSLWGPLSILGVGLIVAAYLLTPTGRGGDGGRAVGWGTVSAVAGAALVLANPAVGWTRRVLGVGAMVFVGRMSYSLYVWHWPVIVFNDTFGWGLTRKVVFVVIFAVGMASYFGIEQTTRRRSNVMPMILVAGALTLIAAVALAWWAPRHPYDTAGFSASASYSSYYDLRPGTDVSATFTQINRGVQSPPRDAPHDAYLHRGIYLGPATQPDVVILGDSHGTAWSQTLRRALETQNLTAAFFSMNGVSPFFNIPPSPRPDERGLTGSQWEAYDRNRLEKIRQWRPPVVIVITRWTLASPQLYHDLFELLHTTADQVLILEQPPELLIGDRNVKQWLIYQGIQPSDHGRATLPTRKDAAYTERIKLAKEVVAHYDNFTLIPVADLYREGEEATVLDGRDAIYLDDDHLTDFGTELARGRIEAAIREALRQAEAGDAVRLDPSPSP